MKPFSGVDKRLLSVQFSFLLTTLGARCNQLAIAWWVLQETNSTVYFANMVSCSIAAEVLAKPLLGWIGDSYNKIAILKLISSVSFIAALLMALLSARGSLTPWAVGALMVISGVVAGVRDPLQASVISLFAEDSKVALAFRAKSVMSSFSIILGPILASGVIFKLGITSAFIFDFLAIFGAYALIVAIPTKIGGNHEGAKLGGSSIWNMTCSSFRVVYQVKMEFYLSATAMLVNFALFPFFTILIPIYVKHVMQCPVTYVGILDSCFGLGILIGSYTIIGWLSRVLPRDICVSIGFALLGCNLMIVGTCSSLVIIIIAFFCGGVALMLINIPTSAVRLLATPINHRNRIFSTVSFLSAAGSPIGSFAMSDLTAYLGIAMTITILGCMVFLLSLAVFFIPSFKKIMRTPDTCLNGFYLEKYPKAFAH